MTRLLIVRLGAMGDIIHALPAAAALRERFPDARLDWVVDARHREILDLVPLVSTRIVWRAWAGGWREVARVVADLRAADYDAAFDFQGLLKSAVLARASGARRVIGFASEHLRERTARPFYSETVAPPAGGHVIRKNLALLCAVGLECPQVRFPLDVRESRAAADLRRILGLEGGAAYGLINPGAAWPNKRWPPERFGVVAAALRERHGLPSAVLWGPGEEALAREVVAASRGAAHVAPPTAIADLVAVIAGASLLVSGDTGPLHVATAVGTPLVGIYGPTDAARNGPWSEADVSVSRFAACTCHHQRRCRSESWCLADIGSNEVVEAVARRLTAPVGRA
jgi:heptosyltransferase-1